MRNGYEPWGVTNPWVFADYGQPQRLRGQVSPVVFQTNPPTLRNRSLGDAESELRRAERMEKIAIAGLIVSVTGLGVSLMWYRKMMKKNRRRRHRGRRSR
jgi:hypothetical protein